MRYAHRNGESDAPEIVGWYFLRRPPDFDTAGEFVVDKWIGKYWLNHGHHLMWPKGIAVYGPIPEPKED